MRYASAKETGTATYSKLLDTCRHSRLKAALSSHLPQAAAPRQILAAARPAPSQATYAPAPFTLSDFGGEYLWLACMSVISLLSVLVTGVLTA